MGIKAVLVQQGHPIAYLSRTLALKQQALSAYEKEFLAAVLAMEKWRPYLLGRHFIIKTNHSSLKYLMEQKITTTFQSKWLPKLMGFNNKIVYKKGKANMAANSLSRALGSQLLIMHLSSIDTRLVDRVKVTWQQDLTSQALIQSLRACCIIIFSFDDNKSKCNIFV